MNLFTRNGVPTQGHKIVAFAAPVAHPSTLERILNHGAVMPAVWAGVSGQHRGTGLANPLERLPHKLTLVLELGFIVGVGQIQGGRQVFSRNPPFRRLEHTGYSGPQHTFRRDGFGLYPFTGKCAFHQNDLTAFSSFEFNFGFRLERKGFTFHSSEAVSSGDYFFYVEFQEIFSFFDFFQKSQ